MYGKPPPNKGIPHTKESKQKMKENHADFSGENHPQFGTHHTQEQNYAQSNKLKGRFTGGKNPNFGNKWTQEQKDALSKKKKEQHQIMKEINNIIGEIKICQNL